MSISHIVETYGYAAVFVMVTAESFGIPLPAETALIIAAAYAGQTHRLDPWLLCGIASAAAIIGDNIGFWIGGKGGYPLARKYGHKVGLDERKLKAARYLFDRHGPKVVFFGRFVSILRAYSAFLAGVSRMRWRVFLVANATGGVVWAASYTWVAYLAGSAFEQVSRTLNIILLSCAVLAIAVAMLTVRHQFAKLADKAEQAYPGPL
jgi:membrane protein DedA with SNARE-associated domain